MRSTQTGGSLKLRVRPKPEWLLLPLLIVASIAIYYPIARHNLPVATYVDDRTSLAILFRFHQGSANPKFFMYPTLYYYLTYALTAPFGFSRMLFTGHLLNLAFVALTAFLSYIFCLRHFGSRVAGLVAACCVLFSPTLLWSGAYLCTDVLLSAMTILSIDWLMRYFETGSSRAWRIAMIAVGCAIATKYTAAILFVTYCIAEVAQSYQQRNREAIQSGEGSAPQFSRTAISIVLLSLCAMCTLVAVFFPVHSILNFVASHRTNLDARSAQDYLLFLNRLRRLAIELAIGTALLFVAVKRFKVVYQCISTKRPYYGLLIILGVFVVTTPYSVLDPAKFIYDIGALLRANVVVSGTHQQWSNYWRWLFDTENKLLVVLGILGIGLMAYRAPWRSLIATVYVALYTLAICTPHLGVPRYLDPLIPLLYCGTGLIVSEIWKRLPGINPVWQRTALCLVGAMIVVEMVRTTETTVKAAADHDAFYASYQEVLTHSGPDRSKSTIFYAGFAPSLELQLAGYPTREVSWASLEATPLGAHLGCEDLMILNKREALNHKVFATQDQSVRVLLDDSRGLGQIVLQRQDCR
jgi:hypothetical protein